MLETSGVLIVLERMLIEVPSEISPSKELNAAELESIVVGIDRSGLVDDSRLADDADTGETDDSSEKDARELSEASFTFETVEVLAVRDRDTNDDMLETIGRRPVELAFNVLVEFSKLLSEGDSNEAAFDTSEFVERVIDDV